VAVGLAEDQRRPAQCRGQPGGAGDEAAAPEDDVGAAAPPQRTTGAPRRRSALRATAIAASASNPARAAFSGLRRSIPRTLTKSIS
jgi:hypothetical protein